MTDINATLKQAVLHLPERQRLADVPFRDRLPSGGIEGHTDTVGPKIMLKPAFQMAEGSRGRLTLQGWAAATEPNPLIMHSALLRYFMEVARTGSIRQAAETLNVTASAISRQITKLEAELGVQLFERLHRGLRLTPAGQRVLSHASATLYEFERLEGELHEMRGRKSGPVRIACLDSLASGILPEIIEASHRLHPGITFVVDTQVHGKIEELVASGDADIGITFDIERSADLSLLFEIHTPIFAIASRSHPLATRKSVSLEDCARFPLLVQRDTSPIRRVIGIDPIKGRAPEDILIACSNLSLLKVLIEKGLGIGFFTALGFLAEIRAGTIVPIPLRASASRELRLAVMVQHRRQLTPAAKAVIELMRNTLNDLDRHVSARSGR